MKVDKVCFSDYIKADLVKDASRVLLSGKPLLTSLFVCFAEHLPGMLYAALTAFGTFALRAPITIKQLMNGCG